MLQSGPPTSPPNVTALVPCGAGCLRGPVPALECPSSMRISQSMLDCNEVNLGSYCEGDGECGTDTNANNCAGGHDIYQIVPCATMSPIGNSPLPLPNMAAHISCGAGCLRGPVLASECPTSISASTLNCDEVNLGSYCVADGECGTDSNAHNCGDLAVYQIVSCAPMCDNTCHFASNGQCSDGGPGAEFTACSLGTDCNDCGPRTLSSPPTPPPPSPTEPVSLFDNPALPSPTSPSPPLLSPPLRRVLRSISRAPSHCCR